ncbi:MAG TPA: hypothetical protein VK013_13460 [Myxococcaceae bacterium]|nr:hypothetical protein [Myxococcaceae bacterium]
MKLPSVDQLHAWGRSLREIDSSTLARDPEEGPVRWFVTDGEGEVLVWLSPDGLPHHAQVILGEVALDWSRDSGLTTASFLEAPAVLGGRHDDYFMREGSRNEQAVRDAARALLSTSGVGHELFLPILASLGVAPGSAAG